MSRPALRRIDPYSLRLFVSTAREGSIARGAVREHIAASALSRRIADLEHGFGTALFVRSARGIELTEAGQLVLQRALQIDQDLQHLAREVQALGDQATGEISGTVRLVANMSSMIGFLPERLKAFSTACPRVAVSLAECDTRDVLRACLDDRADAGVGVRTDVPPGLEAWHVANDPLMVVMPRGHALARQRTLRYAEVLAWPLIGIHPGGAMDTELRERADAAHLPRMSPVSVSSFDTACRMVEVGLGIAIIPASAVTAYAGTGKFVRRPLAEPWAARELWLYALRKTPRLRPVQALIEALRGQAPRA